ncbi:MAG: hypothetical protein GX594_09065 [Pirellulaceae bacterium]|nr:hypothetical protein [Pirellulaceae bacterium]
MEIREPADQLSNNAKNGVSRLLRPCGLRWKGYEVRGRGDIRRSATWL